MREIQINYGVVEIVVQMYILIYIDREVIKQIYKILMKHVNGVLNVIMFYVNLNILNQEKMLNYVVKIVKILIVKIYIFLILLNVHLLKNVIEYYVQ